MRSVGDLHDNAATPSPTLCRLEFDAWDAGLDAVNETIFVLDVVNNVSMPLALSAEDVVGCGLLAIFAGTVNERRTFGAAGAAGAAWAGVLEAGDDMAADSLDHRC